MEAKKESRSERRVRPLIVLLIGMVVILLMGCGGTADSSEQVACDIDSYMTEVFDDELTRAIDAYSRAEETCYQTAGEISEALTEQLAEKSWSSVSTEWDGLYILSWGGRNLGSVTLQEDAEPETIFTFDSLSHTVTIIAPFGCTVYINGNALCDDQVGATLGLYPQLLDYEMEILQANHLMVYELDDVFGEVAVEVDTGYVLQQDEDEAMYYVLPQCTAVLADELMEYSEGFIGAYVNFTLNKKSLWTVQQYTVEDGSLFNSLTQASIGLDWGNGIKAKIEKTEIKDFTYYENAVTCQAVYKMSTNTGARTDTARILLVNTEDGWRVAVIEEMS